MTQSKQDRRGVIFSVGKLRTCRNNLRNSPPTRRQITKLFSDLLRARVPVIPDCWKVGFPASDGRRLDLHD